MCSPYEKSTLRDVSVNVEPLDASDCIAILKALDKPTFASPVPASPTFGGDGISYRAANAAG